MLIPYTAPRATFQKELEIKKSIFLATLIPVKNEEEAQEAIAKMKKKRETPPITAPPTASEPRESTRNPATTANPRAQPAIPCCTSSR